LLAIYATVTSQFFLEKLAKVILHSTLATTVPFCNISTLCTRNENLKKIYNFSESSRSRIQRFKEPHVALERQIGHPCYIQCCFDCMAKLLWIYVISPL